MTKKATKKPAKKVEAEPVVFGRAYGPSRQALEMFACTKCHAEKGDACVGVPNPKFPSGYPWPKSKVHAARLDCYNETL